MSTPLVLSQYSAVIMRMMNTRLLNQVPSRIQHYRHYSSTLKGETLLNRLKSDIKTSMKSKDQFTSTVLKSLLSDITYASKSGPTPKDLTTDAELLPIFQKALKRRQESIAQYIAGNRLDLAEQEKSEIEILKKYLPEEMSVDDIREEVRKIVQEIGAEGEKDLGKVMKEWKIDGVRAPKKVVTNVVKQVLAEM